MADHAEAIRRHLKWLKELRGPELEKPRRLAELKVWQSQRLAESYADIAKQPRYRLATSFFLDDLYGPKDFSARDQEMMRIVPTMSRILPDSAVETAALAIELDALSEDLDQRLAKALPAGPITDASYAKAYRESSSRVERERQIALIDAVGHRLDSLVKKPLVFGTLKLMRQPARVAGLLDLQDFLERGFASFREMKGADDFLALLRNRETEILNRLFSGAANPFSV
ncbi:MAG: FFLEELY motif protein [Usitatibacter sp.]